MMYARVGAGLHIWYSSDAHQKWCYRKTKHFKISVATQTVSSCCHWKCTNSFSNAENAKTKIETVGAPSSPPPAKPRTTRSWELPHFSLILAFFAFACIRNGVAFASHICIYGNECMQEINTACAHFVCWPICRWTLFFSIYTNLNSLE